ncbi:unnamed protein product [Allacma fusca]|uniref:Uncharacterized protein n=1 Tax=Allacma fusca TaxID=39272 RepID=A0A8J2JUW9_9HEXA|nr:unnamed protein product [Allacma fusca]
MRDGIARGGDSQLSEHSSSLHIPVACAWLSFKLLQLVVPFNPRVDSIALSTIKQGCGNSIPASREEKRALLYPALPFRDCSQCSHI